MAHKKKMVPDYVLERMKEMAIMSQNGMSQSDIAKKTGLSRQRIHQILNKASGMGMLIVRRQKKEKICPSCGIRHVMKVKGGFCSAICRKKVNPPKFGGPSSCLEVDIMTCDGCGVKFSRTKRLSYIYQRATLKRGRVPKRKFCTTECYNKNRVITK